MHAHVASLIRTRQARGTSSTLPCCKDANAKMATAMTMCCSCRKRDRTAEDRHSVQEHRRVQQTGMSRAGEQAAEQEHACAQAIVVLARACVVLN